MEELELNPQPIRAYMARYNLTQKQFGDLVGKSQAAVSQWLSGAPMSPRTAKHIEKRTGGAVRVARLFPGLLKRAA